MSKILTSIHGKQLGLDSKGRVIAPKGLLSGDDGNQISLDSPVRVSFTDDFIGDVIADQCNFVEGSDSATSDAAILAGGIGGVVRFTTGDVTGVTAGNVLSNVEQLNYALQWQASNGDLVFQARLKLSSITTSFAFLGFTDLASSAELPIEGSGTADGITTNASDAVGFLFDVRMTNKKWWLVGVAADVDATAQNSAIAPVADKYQTFRIEVSAQPVGGVVPTNASAKFFINGVPVGTVMSNALVSATDLTPTVAISKAFADTTSITADLDYIHVAMDRGLDGTSI